MYKLIMLTASMLLLFSACKKSTTEKKIPACISNEIENSKKDPLYYVEEITEYVFQGRIVYAFKPDDRVIADAGIVVKDSACQTICSFGTDNGSGMALCNGVDFYGNAIAKRVIWKKK